MHAQPVWQQQQQQQQGCRLPAPLQQFLSARRSAASQQQQQQTSRTADSLAASTGGGRGGVLLVDFGSMGCLGLLRDARVLLAVLLQALHLLNWRGVLVTGGWQPLANAHAALDPNSQQPRLFLQHQPLACHHLLLRDADAVLHHGGAGTTAAALAAGTPQLVCPLQFDQFYWAERIAHLNCSRAALSVEQLLPQEAVSTSKQSGQPQQQQQQQQRGEELACAGACSLQQAPSQTAAAAAAAAPAHGPVQGAGSSREPVSAAAVGAAAAYLASHVQAACQADVQQACNSMRKVVAQESGLQQAAASVMRYCRCLEESSRQQQQQGQRDSSSS
ncbi:hypothetical protein COO60DRAFT_1020081 [Scenedesmus sp. NREL 46B-D3]|nr:hypothetical protein COO60DRAFT_1020081 [Scenedesmus sp. NREL 46B-D3]